MRPERHATTRVKTTSPKRPARSYVHTERMMRGNAFYGPNALRVLRYQAKSRRLQADDKGRSGRCSVKGLLAQLMLLPITLSVTSRGSQGCFLCLVGASGPIADSFPGSVRWSSIGNEETTNRKPTGDTCLTDSGSNNVPPWQARTPTFCCRTEALKPCRLEVKIGNRNFRSTGRHLHPH
jgi:hypothetical protein